MRRLVLDPTAVLLSGFGLLLSAVAASGCSASSEGDVGSGSDIGVGGGRGGVVVDQSDGGTGSSGGLGTDGGRVGEVSGRGDATGAGDDSGPTGDPECVLAADCDDGDPCTDDACTGGACGHALNASPCDDGDPCTDSDACAGGTCAGTPLSCDDANGCTVDACLAGVCRHSASDVETCRMRIEVTSPARGAVVTGNPTLGIKGKVTSPAGPVTSMTLNGGTVAVGAAGGFSVAFTAVHGINVLQLEASNGLDQTARASQALLYGAQWHPLGTPEEPTLIDAAIGAWMAPELFDDDDTETLDDMATLVTLVVEGFDLASALPDPLFPPESAPSFAWCEWEVSISNVSLEVESVDLDLITGGLALSIVFRDLYTYVSAVAPDFGCPDAIGPATAEYVTADATIGLSVVDGKPVVTVGDVSVEVLGAQVTIEDGFAEYFDWLVDFFEEDLANLIEAQIEDLVPNSIAPLLQGVLEQVASFERDITVPAFRAGGSDATVHVALGLEDADLEPNGADLVMRFGSAAGSVNEAADLMPGTLASAGCVKPQLPHPSTLLPHASRVEGAVSEDVANQLLHALWASGYTHMTLGDELLGAALGGFGLSEVEMQLAPLLPPIATSCTASGDLELQLGDVEIDATFMAGGQPASMRLFASLTAGLTLAVVEDPAGANLLGVDSVTPGVLAIDIVESQGLSFGDDVLELLLAAALLDQLGGDLILGLVESFPVPVIDISTLVPGVPAGTELTISPEIFDIEGAHLVVGGSVSEP